MPRVSEALTTEEAVRAASSSVLGAEPGAVGRLPFGNINEVFKVEADGRAYVFKVFRNADWPEAGKLPWVESRLKRRGVRITTFPEMVGEATQARRNTVVAGSFGKSTCTALMAHVLGESGRDAG